MRASEFITEGAARLQIGGVVLWIDEHAIEQVYMRNIKPSDVDNAMRKISGSVDELMAIPPGQKIWVVDPATDVALGIRRRDDAKPTFTIKTAVQPMTYDSDVPVVKLNEVEQLEELSFMGMSQCTKDCSGHRAGYEWSKARGGQNTASWSDSFNRGAAIAAAGY